MKRGELCRWTGCGISAEANLEARALCRNHFYAIASERIDEYRKRLHQFDLSAVERIEIPKLLSEVIHQTTFLVTTAKMLNPQDRDHFLELTLSASALYKRIQRNPREQRSLPVVIYRETDSISAHELTNTIDISKQGASVTTRRLWKAGETIRIEKTDDPLGARARVVWIKKDSSTQFLMGLEILESRDFWSVP